jgi:hypothetical protein
MSVCERRLFEYGQIIRITKDMYEKKYQIFIERQSKIKHKMDNLRLGSP